jgi:hypothetical protein
MAQGSERKRLCYRLRDLGPERLRHTIGFGELSRWFVEETAA